MQAAYIQNGEVLVGDMPDPVPGKGQALVRERMVPGEGEMPLRDYLAALPPSVTISLEVPLRSQAEAGIEPEIRLRRCVEAARRLLAEVQA